MGAWGVAFNQGDDYFNHIGDLVDPLLAELARELYLSRNGKYFDGSGGSRDAHVIAYHATSPFRTALVTATRMLRGLPSVSLTDSQFETLTEGVSFVLKNVRKARGDWAGPDEFEQVVRDEMDEIAAWLQGFARNSSLLADRLPAILAILGRS